MRILRHWIISGLLAFVALLSNFAIAANETTSKDFSVQNQPHLPAPNVVQFEDGRDYFSYQSPIDQSPRADGKIAILFFFDYDCRVCSSAQDILELYSQMKPDVVALQEYPIATADSHFSADIFYSLHALQAGELSSALLFETSEKARYMELSRPDQIQQWVVEQGLDGDEFRQMLISPVVKAAVQQAETMTEDYGVFTYPYVVIDGKYVLTASTLYNDDYSFAVLDFLINKIKTEKQ